MDLVLATLQKINDTWCYSTRKTASPKKLFGKPVPAHLDVSYSHFIPGTEKTSNGIDTYFLNGLTNQDAQLYREEYGAQAYIQLQVDAQTGHREPVDLLTLDMYEQLNATSQPTSQPSAS